MTLEEFTTLRRDELREFFAARFGSHWTRIVANHVGFHPRTFEYWKNSPPTSLYRQLLTLEKWARSIGFLPSTDEELQSRIQRHEEFQRAAAAEIQERKRNEIE